ncbi:hypothetical protein BOX15_Mlig018445g1 [Macrostomum lignano]|uniref:BHLH domain-containing protein n=1 Tax=Macrostomum lignano TaxID=282301 RepID=A0A267EX02_9PLAT|nr:hypothetical protein BOX15_Mlig018445g1 [Macrostomum lignano]
MSYPLDDILSDLRTDELGTDFDLMSGVIPDHDPLLDDTFVQQIMGEFDQFNGVLDQPLEQQQQQQQPALLKAEPVHQQKFNVLESLLRNPTSGPVVTPAPPAVTTTPCAVSSTTSTAVASQSAANQSVTATDKLIALLLQQREDTAKREDLIAKLVRQVCQEQQQLKQHRPGPQAEQLAAAFRELSTAQLEQLASGSLQLVLPNANNTTVTTTAANHPAVSLAPIQNPGHVSTVHQQQQQQPTVTAANFKLERLTPPLSVSPPKASPPSLPLQQHIVQQQQQKQHTRVAEPPAPTFEDNEDDDEEDEEMLVDQDVGGGVSGSTNRRSGGGSGGRKSSHTVIEKKYRQSINNKIDELRRMLVGRDGKLSKSLVLKRTIDRIHLLERENESLRRQLGQQQHSNGSGYYIHERDSSLSAGGLSPGAFEDVVSSGSSNHNSSAGNGTDSPTSLPSPSSSGGNHGNNAIGVGSTLVQLLQQSGVTTATVTSGSSMQQPSTAVRCTMMLAACCFLFLLNPLQLGAVWLSGGVGAGVGLSGSASGRALKSVDLVKEEDNGWSSSVWWWLTTLVNCLILLCLGCRYSPLPSTVSRSEDPKRHAARLLAFERCCSLADSDIRAGSWDRAWSRLRTCLVLLHRPLPVAGSFDWMAQMGWHLVLAACLQICSLFRLALPVSEQQRHLAALASLTYGRLLQLTIGIGDTDRHRSDCTVSRWQLRVLLLNCNNFLNLAGSSADTVLPIGERIRLLASMGLAARRVGLPACIAKQFYDGAAMLASATAANNTNSSSGSLSWMATPQGAAFLAEYRPGGPLPMSHRLDDTVYSSSGCPAKPLDRARSVFVESLLEASVEDLVLSASLATSNCCIADTTRLCQDLFAGRDPESCWWAATARLAAAWRNGDNAEAASMTPAPLPAGLKADRLAASLTLAARAYRTAVFGLTGTSSAASALAAAEQAADLASAGLRELLSSSSVPDDGQPQQRLRWMTQAWCLIGLDWLLSARTAIAQQQPGNRACRRLLTAYQSDLRSARDVSLRIGADPRRWLAAHEAALRLLSGANPLAASFCLRQAESAFGAFANSATAEDADRKLRLVKQLFAAQQQQQQKQAGLDR